jgi:hypothetical protein
MFFSAKHISRLTGARDHCTWNCIAMEIDGLNIVRKWGGRNKDAQFLLPVT